MYVSVIPMYIRIDARQKKSCKIAIVFLLLIQFSSYNLVYIKKYNLPNLIKVIEIVTAIFYINITLPFLSKYNYSENKIED